MHAEFTYIKHILNVLDILSENRFSTYLHVDINDQKALKPQFVLIQNS